MSLRPAGRLAVRRIVVASLLSVSLIFAALPIGATLILGQREGDPAGPVILTATTDSPGTTSDTGEEPISMGKAADCDTHEDAAF